MAFTKMLWKIGYTAPASWDLWKSVRSQIFKLWNFTYTKSNDKIAYYALIHVDGIYVEMEGTGKGKMPILISPDPDAVAFYRTYGASTQSYTSQGSFTDANGITWYYCYATAGLPESLNIDIPSEPCELNSKDNPYTYNAAGMEQAAQDLLDKVYEMPFTSAYTVNTVYNLSRADLRKTIRKLIGVHLYQDVSYYSSNPRLAYLSDNADSIITLALNCIGNDDIAQMRLENLSSMIKFEIDHLSSPFQTECRYAPAVRAGYKYQMFFAYPNWEVSHTRDTIQITASSASVNTPQTVTDFVSDSSTQYGRYIFAGLRTNYVDSFGYSTLNLISNLGIDL